MAILNMDLLMEMENLFLIMEIFMKEIKENNIKNGEGKYFFKNEKLF